MGHLVVFALKRLALVPVMVLLVVTIIFFVVSSAPGSPFSESHSLPPQVEANLKAKYGLDQPRWKQYIRFISRLAGFSFNEDGGYKSWHPYPDFGESTKYRDRSVNEIILNAAPISVVLGATAYGIALFIGLAAGVIAAWRKNSWVDRVVTFVATLGLSVPTIILGPLLVIVVCLTLYLLPPARLDWAVHWGWFRIPTISTLILPALTLSGVYIAYIARLSRAGILEVLQQDYIRTARANGLPEWRVLIVHALRGGLLSVLTFSGPALASLVAGTVVVEKTFAIPGLGSFFIDAVSNRDYFLILGLSTFGAIVLMLANVLVDIAYAYMDPRIRYD